MSEFLYLDPNHAIIDFYEAHEKFSSYGCAGETCSGIFKVFPEVIRDSSQVRIKASRSLGIAQFHLFPVAVTVSRCP